jgi:hypothetical protein
LLVFDLPAVVRGVFGVFAGGLLAVVLVPVDLALVALTLVALVLGVFRPALWVAAGFAPPVFAGRGAAVVTFVLVGFRVVVGLDRFGRAGVSVTRAVDFGTARTARAVAAAALPAAVRVVAAARDAALAALAGASVSASTTVPGAGADTRTFAQVASPRSARWP